MTVQVDSSQHWWLAGRGVPDALLLAVNGAVAIAINALFGEQETIRRLLSY